MILPEDVSDVPATLMEILVRLKRLEDQMQNNQAKQQTQPQPKRPFIKPTEEDVVRFAVVDSALQSTDGEWFWAHMEAQEWTNNGRPVKNWKQTIKAWKLARFFPSQKLPNGYSQAKPAEPSVYTLQECVKAMQADAAQIREQHSYEYPDGRRWSNEAAREKFNHLNQKIREIKAKIQEKLV